MAAHAAFDGGAEVLPQVKAVGHLDCVRRTGAGTFSVGAGSVTAGDLGTGMLSQPSGQCRGVTAGQQVEGPAGFAVDETVP
ncbi:hypothetical protein GCM10010449_05260 [Streptomyces rectiviolaceus]|uniref:Uncharacterized protein n=1 Tax=Streptomyces rectiviolaceus TaxID=332591 RepID=A0ABP6M730_9ACTN